MNQKLIVSGQSTLVQRRMTFLSFELGSQRFAFGFFKHVAREVIGRWGEGILSSCEAETFRTNGK